VKNEETGRPYLDQLAASSLQEYRSANVTTNRCLGIVDKLNRLPLINHKDAASSRRYNLSRIFAHNYQCR